VWKGARCTAEGGREMRRVTPELLGAVGELFRDGLSGWGVGVPGVAPGKR